MTKPKEVIEFIKPSSTGLALYFTIALILILLNAHYLSPLVTTVTGGPENVSNTLHINSILNWTNREMLSYLGVSTSINMVVGLIWGVVGLLSYIVCSIIFRFFGRLWSVYKLKEYVLPRGSSRSHFLFDPLERLLVQLLMTIVLIFYIFIIMAPILLGRTWPIPSTGKDNYLADLARIVIYVLILHGFVLILRLVYLHERLGQEVELPETHSLE